MGRLRAPVSVGEARVPGGDRKRALWLGKESQFLHLPPWPGGLGAGGRGRVERGAGEIRPRCPCGCAFAAGECVAVL